MDHIQGLKVFVSVAQHLSFAAAARDLLLSPAAVTKHVSALEERIGARLFDRTTRKVGLTEGGRVYFERSLECLRLLEDADASVSELSKAARGLLRMTAPIDFGDIVLPVIAQVMNDHPELVVDLRLSNRVSDIVDEGIDVAVRVIAGSIAGQFVARPLARAGMVVIGAPSYFARHGRPRRPEDLASHRCLVFSEPRPWEELAFTRGAKTVHAKLTPVMTCNHGEALRNAARHGVGLAMMPSFELGDALTAGGMETVLSDWSLPELKVFAVYPHRRYLSPKVKVMVEALRAALGDGTTDPWWPAPAVEAQGARAAPSRRAAPRR